MEKTTITVKTGAQYDFYKIKGDASGNPRYVVSFMALGLKKYEATKQTRKLGLAKYRGKNFGGGFVFSAYNLQYEAELFAEAGLSNKIDTPSLST